MQARLIEKACVVGLGPHALTKLVPALQSNGQEIAAVVTSQKKSPIAGARLFSRLEDAVQALPLDVTFVVASPPAAHLAQAELILSSGRDMFLEKPAFVAFKDVEAVAELCERKGVVLLEGLMYRYASAYERLMAYWRAHAGEVVGFTAKFLIPEARQGSFRDDPATASSIVYDIGCYPVSLLSHLGGGPLDLEIEEVAHAGDQTRERAYIVGSAGAIAVDIEIGMSDGYANWVELRRRSGETLRIQPFFYGRKGLRSMAKDGRTETFEEPDAFERMFRLTREELVLDQPERFRAMISATRALAGLGSELQLARRQARRG